MFLQQLINGVMLGSIYSLIAIGYNLILGVLDMITLAHGDVFMLGGFLGLFLVLSGVPLVLAFVGAMIAAGFISIICERLCFNPLKKASILAPLVSTIAFGMVLQNIAGQVWGSQATAFPRSYIEGTTFHLGSVSISTVQIAILCIALLLMVGIDLLINKTKLGRAVRAVSEDPETASLMGVSTRNIVLFTFMLAGALAGAAGMLVFLTFGQMDPYTGSKLGLFAMVAIVIGGMGSIRGAMVGGLILGMVEIMNAAYFMGSIRDIVFFGVMLVFIMVRPQGLFGAKIREA